MIKILFSPKRAERHPFEMMLVGIFYSSISILLSAWIFPGQASLVMVFFTVLSCVYVIQGAITIEEKKGRKYNSEAGLLKSHSKLLVLLLFLFIGFVFSFAFWSAVLPNEKTSLIFNLQSSSVEGIKTNVMDGDGVTGGAVSDLIFLKIIFNNLKVLFFSLILAFFYGAGAIFVLVWNASTMGFVIGNLAKTSLGLAGLPIAFAKYLVHGIPEMLAYLTVSLAGGIIYTAVWRGDFFDSKKRRKIVFDAVVLVFIAVILLVVAALIEIYISPYI